MIARRLASLAAAALLAAVALPALVVSRAHAACTYYNVDALNTFATSTSPQIVQLPQSQPVWSAFAVRPQAGEDWDVTLYQNSAADPACVANVLAGSAGGGSVVDFVIGDYAANPAGTYYAYCNRFSGASAANIRWTDSPQVLTLNAPQVTRSWGATQLIETWNAQLTAGTTYNISFGVYAGAMNARVMIFRNPTGGTYWAGRIAAVLNSATSTTYTAPSSGNYAVVVVNDDGGTGSFYLGLGTCVAPTALVPGAATHTNLGNSYYSFNQSDAYWTAIGARSTTSDYDISVWGGAAGAGYPYCLSDSKASSSFGDNRVDFVVGDFNHTPAGTYYVQATDFSGPGGADVEWDSGANLLPVDGAPATRTSDATDVLEVWDVFLSAGQTYTFSFTQSGTNMHMLLFRNGGGGVLWAGRASGEFDVTGCTSYTAPTGGFYGLVIVNDTGEHANFAVGVGQAPCSCPTPLVSNTPTLTASPDGYFSFSQGVPFWGVIATRGITNADDWDLTVSASGTGNPAPTCFGPVLTASSYGSSFVDIGAIDFNRTPLGTYFARTHHFSGPAASGWVEWDGTHGLLSNNDALQFRSMSSSDLAHVWDAYMVAGTTYQIQFSPSGGSGEQLLVFENAAGGTFAAHRGAAALTTGSSASYTPTATGYHGFVVVNDAATNGSYTLRFGSCLPPTPLASGTAQILFAGVEDLSFVPVPNQWSVVGVRSDAVDWDISASPSLGGTFPTCLGGTLASSNSGAVNFVDFVVADFFHNPPGTYYAQASQFTPGISPPTQVEWSAGNGEVLVNDNNYITHGSSASDMLQSYGVFMNAGQSYEFNFAATGAANLHLLVYQNAAGGAYWTGRAGSVIDLTPGGGPFNYVAPTSGEYGIVIVNDDGVADIYSFKVKTCDATTALAAGVSTVDATAGFHSFNQVVPFWTAIGVRSSSDWDIDVNSNPGGGTPGVCQTGLLANSIGVGTVDFVVGDFNPGANAAGTYYTRPYRFNGSATGTVEWDSGADQIVIGAPTAHRVTGASDVLEIWDVKMAAGQAYGIYFTHTGAADVKVLIFRNPGGPYWAGRSANVYQNTGNGNYTAPSTGWYGVVVVNDNGASGSYDVGVYKNVLAVEPGAVSNVTSLNSVQPNPARARMNIEYTLAERAPVRIQMLDLAGRVVADVDQQTREAGVWQAGWNGTTREGRKAAPGLYLVRLEVNGRTVGQRKVTLIE